MRKSLLILVPFALVPLAGLALPAMAGSGQTAGAAQPAAESLDLGAVPVKPVTGHLAISGIAVDDESDDMPAVGKGVGSTDDAGLGAESENEDAD